MSRHAKKSSSPCSGTTAVFARDLSPFACEKGFVAIRRHRFFFSAFDEEAAAVHGASGGAKRPGLCAPRKWVSGAFRLLGPPCEVSGGPERSKKQPGGAEPSHGRFRGPLLSPWAWSHRPLRGRK